METLRSLRSRHALSLLDLAARTGIPARQIAEIEHGLRRLSPEQRERLAHFLGLRPTDFTGAHRRLTGAVAAAVAPPADQRLLQLLATLTVATSLAAAGATVRSEMDLPRWNVSLPAAIATSNSQPRASDPDPGSSNSAPIAIKAPQASPMRPAVGALPTMLHPSPFPAPAPTTPPAALSPALLAGPPPAEHLAPAPLPSIETLPPFRLSDAGPLGCPVAPTRGRVVITQGYGVGTHAPAAIWGAIDLAVDDDGDGYAEAGASWYAPIVATHDGYATVTPNSHPGGNYVSIQDPGGVWRTGYGHLALITVIHGQFVRAGEQIGLMGNSGVASGPHLDYQVWRGGVNIDPTPLVGC
ncbi:MAG: peptidoglycan DD-metalloendopeptidase family protein [Oscillochloridaceae bacterium]|nr:peptidoglycan DD-metalloendopeptidase family protein [Chloroflexaceae bacterium]MDW8389925.1 peptidoglycan DD-metalloendopeptidase family protein [Oscillochloridaceae bacterium]